MRKALAVLLMIFPVLATAAVVNVEFHFAPYTGNPDTEDVIVFVPGQTRLFVNGLPFAEVEVREQKYQIIFSDREISSAPVSLTGESFGALLRKSTNTLRVEFVPADAQRTYTAELRWASVTDGVTETRTEQGVSSTNLAQQGRDRQTVQGTAVLEREFQADFVHDLPWHHYPPVQALGEADKQQIRTLVAQRLQALQPDFKVFYAWLDKHNFKVADIRKGKVLEKIHASGLRVKMVDAARLEFIVGGGPGVMVKAAGTEPVYRPENPQALSKVTTKGAKDFATSVLPQLFPARLIVARTPSGVWEAVD